MHVVDPLHFRVPLEDDRVEAHFAAHLLKYRIQGSKCLHVGIRPQMLVAVQDDGVVVVLNRNDRILEPVVGPGLHGPFLRLDGVGVDIITGKAVLGGDQVRRNALLHVIGLEGHLRVGEPRAAARRHGNARHRLDAAADGEVGLARHDLGGRHVDRLEA